MKEQERRGEIRKKVKNGERRRIQIKLTREIMPKKKRRKYDHTEEKEELFFFQNEERRNKTRQIKSTVHQEIKRTCKEVDVKITR